MKLSHKVASIAITSAAALTLALSAQAAHADTYNGSEVTGHWTDAHGVAGYHVAGQADLVNNGGIWYQNGQEISVDGIIPGYHATETAPVSPQPAVQQPAPAPQQPAVQQPAVQTPSQPAPQAPAPQQPAVQQPAAATQPAQPAQPAPSQPSTPTPSKPKADAPTTQPNQHVETDSTNKSHELHQTDTTHGVQQLASTPDDTSKTIYPAQEGKAHAAANPNYSDGNHNTGKYSDTHSVLPQTGVANTIGLVALGIATICSALSAALSLNRDRNNRDGNNRRK